MDNLLITLDNIELIDDSKNFEIFSYISKKLIGDKDAQNEARNFIIHLIDKWGELPTQFKLMWEELIEAVGFYPYIEKYKMSIPSFDGKVRQKYHTSSIPNVVFHKEQKELAELLFEKRNVIVSAPTSFGKSLLIDEIISSQIYKNIVIIQPTLALLDETRIRLNKFRGDYKIIVRTSQPYNDSGRNIFLLTAERVLEYPSLPKIDLLILDEFYKISKKRDDSRANTLNIAFIKLMKNPDCKFYFLGPNVDDISNGFEQKYNAIFYRTDYSLVSVEEEDKSTNVKKKKGGKVFEDDLFIILDDMDEQTLIFCSSPQVARNLAFEYAKHLKNKGMTLRTQLPLAEWIQSNVNKDWSLVSCLNYGIGVHDGSLPKHIATSTIQYFNDRKLNFLFCTNTIIEGVNTSAKNVILYDNKIATNPIDFFDYSNIRGRAGRLMQHQIGKIITLQQPPKKTKTIVDIPAFEQNPIDDEVLVHHEEKDIIDVGTNKKRFEDFSKLDLELQAILKANNVSIKGQMEVLEILERDIQDPTKNIYIIWNNLSDLFNRLHYLFNLCKNRFQNAGDKMKGLTIKQLAFLTQNYCISHSIKDIITNRINYKKSNTPADEYNKQATVDEAIEFAFKFQKNWLQYYIPKWLGVMDKLQKYVAKKKGLPAGDYSQVAKLVENEIMEESLQILTEYGIPTSAILKIKESYKHLKNKSEDEVVDFIISKRQEVETILTEYEKDTLKRI